MLFLVACGLSVALLVYAISIDHYSSALLEHPTSFKVVLSTFFLCFFAIAGLLKYSTPNLKHPANLTQLKEVVLKAPEMVIR